MGILSTKSESIDASRRVRTKITTTPAAAATTTITTIPAKSKVSVKNCVIFCSLLNRPKRRQDFDGHKEMNEKHHHNKITAFKKKGGKKEKISDGSESTKQNKELLPSSTIGDDPEIIG